MPVLIPVSHGEYFDRLTILELKAARIQEPDKRARATAQLAQLRGLAKVPDPPAPVADLRAVNSQLWELERRIRTTEGEARFAELARQIQRLNGDRAALKAQIDAALGGAPGEVKDYG